MNFSFFRDQDLALLVIQCQNSLYQFMVIFVGRSRLVSVTLSYAKAEDHNCYIIKLKSDSIKSL